MNNLDEVAPVREAVAFCRWPMPLHQEGVASRHKLGCWATSSFPQTQEVVP